MPNGTEVPRAGASLRGGIRAPLSPTGGSRTPPEPAAPSALRPSPGGAVPAPTAPAPISPQIPANVAPQPQLPAVGPSPAPPAAPVPAPPQAPAIAPEPGVADRQNRVDELQQMIQRARGIGDFALVKQYEEQLRMLQAGATPESIANAAIPGQSALPVREQTAPQQAPAAPRMVRPAEVPGFRPSQVQAMNHMMRVLGRNLTSQESGFISNANDAQLRQMIMQTQGR